MKTSNDTHLTLQAVGVMLFGVLLSIGATVAFGIAASWWIRLGAGVLTTTGLVVFVWLLGTRTTLLARLGDWITGRSYGGSR